MIQASGLILYSMSISRSTTFLFLLLFFSATLISSCGDDEGGSTKIVDNFDREAMLQFWADEVIVPSFVDYDNKLNVLVDAKDAFLANKDENSFNQLRDAWLEAYKSWQHVSMFDIGKAEEIGYRNFVNIFPADTDLIDEHILDQQYNLELPSTFDAQGFPALDYLLFGLANELGEQITLLGQENHSNYLGELVDKLKSLNGVVLNDWQSGYRDDFVENKGSSATASTDKLVNDFLFYYEKYFRAGKIGIPAGVFSGNSLSTAVEAPYSGIYSKTLFNEAFEAIRKFYDGESFNGQQTGNSLKQYLEHIQQANDMENISEQISEQWGVAEVAINGLLDNFKDQVEQDNLKMLQAYDEVQKVVVLLKVDMMQALNIQVDYVDADGD